MSKTVDSTDLAGSASGRPFKKGNQGRPKGARNKSTLFLQELMEGQGEAIVQKVVEKALGGDMAAVRLCLDRIMVARRSRSVKLNLPPIKCAADVHLVLAKVSEAVGAGEITPDEAAQLAVLYSKTMEAFQAVDWESRIKRLEELEPRT
jgi:hypothetical protein